MSKHKKQHKQVHKLQETGAPPKDYFSLSVTHFGLIALGVFCIVVYGNSLVNGFVYDDTYTIVQNTYLHNWNGDLSFLVTPSYFEKSGEMSYRPVTTLSYYMMYALFQLHPAGYHVVSVGLHLVNMVLVYLLVIEITWKPTTALIAALLFGAHPALTEAVDCISYNEDVLMTLFALLALLVYLKWKQKGGYLLSWLLYGLALLSKEMAITLPGLIGLYDLTIREAPTSRFALIKQRAGYYIGLIVISAGYLIVRFRLLLSPEVLKPISYGPLAKRLLYVPYNLGWFLKIALAPFPLSADYGFAYPESFWAVPNLLAWGSVTGLILLSVFFYQRTRSITFGVWWFLFTLTPVLNLIEIHNPITDRYLYLPLVGLVLSIAVVIQEHFEGFFPQTWPIRIIKYSIVPGIVLVYAVLTMVRNTEWKDEYRLWTTTVKYFPKSNTAHYNLGLVYIRQGLIEEAIREFQQAIAIRPGDIQAHNNLGFIYVHQGRLDDAIREFQTALAIHPDLMRGYDLVSVHNNLGLVYAQQGLVEESIREYQKALVIRPDDAETRNNLGIIYAQQGRFEEASREFQKVLAIQPDNANAYYNLGSVCMQQGRFEEAIREYQKALAIQPGYAEAHNNLGVIYAQQSHFEDAIREFQAALAIYPGYDDARNNLDRATASQKLLY